MGKELPLEHRKNRGRAFRLEMLEERCLLSVAPWNGHADEATPLVAAANSSFSQPAQFSTTAFSLLEEESVLSFSGETLCQMAVDGTSLAVLSYDASQKGFLRLYQWENGDWQCQTEKTFWEVETAQFGKSLSMDGRDILVDSGETVSIFHWNGTTLSETVLPSERCEAASLDGDIAVLGGENSVSVYRNTLHGWQLEKKWDGATGESLGAKVLYDAATERLFVSDYAENTVGKVSVYERDLGKWTLRQTLSGDVESGCSLSVDGDTLAVGAADKVTIWEYSETSWNVVDTVLPTTSVEETPGQFGGSVTLSGDRLWVGDSLASRRSSTGVPSVTGAVYTFEKTESGWVEGEVLWPSASGNVLRYGESVFLNEDFAVVMVSGNGTIVTRNPGESAKEELKVESVLLDGNQVVIGFSEILAASSTPRLQIGSETLTATEILNGNKVVWTLPQGFSETDYTLVLSGISDLHGCSLATTESTLDWVYDKTTATATVSFQPQAGTISPFATVTFSEDMALPLENGFLLMDGMGKEYSLQWSYEETTRTAAIFLEESLSEGDYLFWIQGGAMGWCDRAGNPIVNVGERFVVGEETSKLEFSSGKATVSSYLLAADEVAEYTVKLTAGQSYQWRLQDSMNHGLLLEVYDGETLIARGSPAAEGQSITGWVPATSKDYTIRISCPAEAAFPGNVLFTLEGTEKTASMPSELSLQTSIQDGDVFQTVTSVRVTADRSFDLSKMDIRKVTLTPEEGNVKNCTGYGWVDGRTVEFFFDGVSEGTWTLNMEAGTVYSLDGKTAAAIGLTFTVDQTSPGNPTLPEDWSSRFILPEDVTETLKMTVVFAEAMRPDSFDPSDIRLAGVHSGNTAIRGYELSADGKILTLDLGRLPMDSYVLTLNTTGAFTDLAGNSIQTTEDFSCLFGVISKATLPLPETMPQRVNGDVVSQTMVNGYVTKTETNRYSFTVPEGGQWFSWSSDDAIVIEVQPANGSEVKGSFLEAGNYTLVISMQKESTANQTAYSLVFQFSEVLNTQESAGTLTMDVSTVGTLSVCGEQTGSHYYQLPAFSHGFKATLSEGFSVSLIDSAGNSAGTMVQEGNGWMVSEAIPEGYCLKVTANTASARNYTLLVEELTNSVALSGTVEKVTLRFEYPVESNLSWSDIVTIQKGNEEITSFGTFELSEDGKTLTWLPSADLLAADEILTVTMDETTWGNSIPLEGSVEGIWSGTLTIASSIAVSVELSVTDEKLQSVTWLHEWQPYWVEIHATAETALAEVDWELNIHYRPDLFTLDASSLPMGWSVTEQNSGILTITASTENVPENAKTLLGKIRFQPVPRGGIALDMTTAELPVRELGLRVESLVGTEASGMELDGKGTEKAFPKVYPVLYDFDDSGTVDIDDLIFFAKNFSNSADASTNAFYCDLDHSGIVDIDDLILFAKNFSNSVGSTLSFANNYPAMWETGQNLVLAECGTAKTEEIPVTLEQETLDTFSEVVIERATTEFGVTVPADVWKSVTFRVTDLGGNVLATQIGNVLWIDQTAAGYGWYLDATPYDDTDDNFHGQVDLLSVLFHEWGHLAGEEHSEVETDWMWESLVPGVRRLPDVMDKIFGDP